VAFLRRRRQRLRQQNSAQDTSLHQLLIELYTFWRVLLTIEYRRDCRKSENGDFANLRIVKNQELTNCKGPQNG
jgi:hypothetical protein